VGIFTFSRCRWPLRPAGRCHAHPRSGITQPSQITTTYEVAYRYHPTRVYADHADLLNGVEHKTPAMALIASELVRDRDSLDRIRVSTVKRASSLDSQRVVKYDAHSQISSSTNQVTSKMMSMTASQVFSAANTPVVVESSTADARGNILASLQADGSTLSYDATDGDLVSAITGPSGTVTSLFDGFGNLTNDGVCVYGWDAEMRLVSVEPVTVAEGASRLTYSYDPHSRRDTRECQVYQSGTWVPVERTDFMYAGWLLLAERIQAIDSGSTATSYRVYAWGPDFGDTMQAASPIPSDAIGSMGGIGGLLSVTHQPADGDAATYYYCNDLSGNIVALTDNTGSNIVARYDYTEKGSIADTAAADFTINPFTWRGKYQEPEAGGLLYFGYRHYSPALARWISRDPIGKSGGINENAYYDPDPLGLAPFSYKYGGGDEDFNVKTFVPAFAPKPEPRVPPAFVNPGPGPNVYRKEPVLARYHGASGVTSRGSHLDNL